LALLRLRQRSENDALVNSVVSSLYNVHDQYNKGYYNGGLPGSNPFWAEYLQAKLPNWAAKFYADLLMAVEDPSSISYG